ncbi:MAG: lysylphosphatidylglycerol synthase domain-containing protein, partial [Betaproteobacteria bacterium]
ALLVIACLPWTLNLVTDPLARALLLLIVRAAVAGAVVFLTIGKLRWPLIARFAPTRHLAEVSRVTWQLCHNGRTLAAITVASFAVQMITIAVAWCLAQSVAASASFTLLLYLIPPVLLIATVPVSIAGWGVREGSMIVAFAYTGLAQSDGLIVSVLFGLATFAIGIIGGLIWIASDLRLSALRSEQPSP